MRHHAPPRQTARLAGLLLLGGLAFAACENKFTTTEADPSALDEQRVALAEDEATEVCDASFQDCIAHGVEEDACRARRAQCVASLTTDGPRPGERTPRACWERFDFCIAGGEVEPERCRAGLRHCLVEVGEPRDDAGEPTERPCEDERAACLAADGDPRACDAAFVACRDEQRPRDGQCGDPRPAPVNRCEVRFRECLDLGEAPERCEGAFRQCLQDANAPSPTPEDHAERCHARHAECLSVSTFPAGEPNPCDFALRECLASGPTEEPGPRAHLLRCEDAREACLVDGHPPERCEYRFRTCVADAPQPDTGDPAEDPALHCEARFRDCLAANDSDDAPERCELGFRECLERGDDGAPRGPDGPALRCDADYRACVEAGRDPDACGQAFRQCMSDAAPSEPTPDGHALRCENRFRECLAAGIPGERCDTDFRQCLANPPPPPSDDEPRDPPPPPSPERFCQHLVDVCLGAATTEPERAVCADVAAACRARFEDAAR